MYVVKDYLSAELCYNL